jgi:hypothetical protein
MKKNLIGPLATIIIMVLLAAMFVYFYISLNRQEKKLIAAQATIVEDSAKINAVVNFFNSNLNAASNQK